jgi:hypothetical protein
MDQTVGSALGKPKEWDRYRLGHGAVVHRTGRSGAPAGSMEGLMYSQAMVSFGCHPYNHREPCSAGTGILKRYLLEPSGTTCRHVEERVPA